VQRHEGNVEDAFVPLVPHKAAVGALFAESDKAGAEASRKFIVGGNWKANGSPDDVKKLVEALNAAKPEVDTSKDVEVVCAPPMVYLSTVKDSLRADYAVSAQNMWNQGLGAWTGETPAEMLKGMGIQWTVLGHSERRESCGETNEVVADKTKFAVDNGLKTITCIGEKLDARESGKTFDVLGEQMKPLAAALKEEDWEKVVLAYEPVWAIGTGKVATPEQAEETHAYLRKWLSDNVSPKVSESVRIQYGGSVNDKNAADLSAKPNIDGFLVGGASLNADSFTTIINSASTEKEATKQEEEKVEKSEETKEGKKESSIEEKLDMAPAKEDSGAGALAAPGLMSIGAMFLLAMGQVRVAI
jgi:triosephosphate isomerase